MRHRAQLIAQAVGANGARAPRHAMVAIDFGSMKFMCSHDILVRANARSQTGGSTLHPATHNLVVRIALACGAAGVPAAKRAPMVCLAGEKGLSQWSMQEMNVGKNVQREMEKSRPSIVTSINAAQRIARDIGKSLVHAPRPVAMELRFGSIMSHAMSLVAADPVQKVTYAGKRLVAGAHLAQSIVLVASRSGRNAVLIVVVALSNGCSSSRRWPSMGVRLAVTDKLMWRNVLATRSHATKAALVTGAPTANVMPCALEA